jgi:hypothetical protein
MEADESHLLSLFVRWSVGDLYPQKKGRNSKFGRPPKRAKVATPAHQGHLGVYTHTFVEFLAHLPKFLQGHVHLWVGPQVPWARTQQLVAQQKILQCETEVKRMENSAFSAGLFFLEDWPEPALETFPAGCNWALFFPVAHRESVRRWGHEKGRELSFQNLDQLYFEHRVCHDFVVTRFGRNLQTPDFQSLSKWCYAWAPASGRSETRNIKPRQPGSDLHQRPPTLETIEADHFVLAALSGGRS